MKILLLSDMFLIGGMETNIATYVECAPHGTEFFLATQRIETSEYFKSLFKEIIPISVNKSEINNSLQALSEVIEKYKINAIHSHTYKTYLLALLLKSKCNVPYYLSIHGPSTLEGLKRELVVPALKEAVLDNATVLYCVSKELQEKIYLEHGYKAKLAPNPINLERYKIKKVTVDGKGHWVLISRLDFDKYYGIIEAFNQLKDSCIKSIDVYGTGNAVTEMIKQIEHFKPYIQISLKGSTDKIADILQNENYDGVLGMGRVVLEGGAMDYPAILVGYNGICGLIDEQLFKKAKICNFSGRNLQIISSAELNQQLSKLSEKPRQFSIRSLIESEYDGRVIVKNYIRDLEGK